MGLTLWFFILPPSMGLQPTKSAGPAQEYAQFRGVD